MPKRKRPTETPEEQFARFKEIAMQMTAVLTPAEEGGYVAFNPETGTATQGDTVDEALANLREATVLYLEEFPLKKGGTPLVTTFAVPDKPKLPGIF